MGLFREKGGSRYSQIEEERMAVTGSEYPGVTGDDWFKQRQKRLFAEENRGMSSGRRGSSR